MSANDEPLSNDGGGGWFPDVRVGSINLRNYIAFDRDALRLTFRPLALMVALVYAAWLALFEGIISAIVAFGDGATAIYDALGSWLTQVILLAVGPQGIFAAAFSEASAEVLGSGIAAFGFAVAIVGVTLYVTSIGVDQLR